MDKDDIKLCCARLYESDVAHMLLGDSFHPGGLKLTERLGILLDLGPRSLVLELASGTGASAIFLAEQFGCEVVGVDYGGANVERATAAAERAGLNPKVGFKQADAEELPFDSASFDAVVCECSFCTFSDKSSAAREVARVLRPGGKVGLSDVTRDGDLPEDLTGLLAWVACLADARPVASYMGYLRDAGLRDIRSESHDGALGDLVRQVQMRLLGLELLGLSGKVEQAGFETAAAKQMARAALKAVRQKRLGYAIICAEKPAYSERAKSIRASKR